MTTTTRRTFLELFSGGALAAALASPGRAHGVLALLPDGEELDFGPLEALAARIQTTPADDLQRALIAELAGGTPLDSVVAAAALANARAFGGEDYTGYHCQMALVPARRMAALLPERTAPLPVLKVVHRTARQLHSTGRDEDSTLRPLDAAPAGSRAELSAALRDAYRDGDVDGAERAFAGLVAESPETAWSELQPLVHEDLDVHRVVLAWRSWEVLPLTGREHALTLLRQSVRFAVDRESDRMRRGRKDPLRELLPALLDRHGLEGRAPGKARATDERLEELADVLALGERADAAEAMADALAGGLAVEDAGDALSLASNKLLLCDPGKSSNATPDKPLGSVHGASLGVHACDSARAWRNIAGASDARNALASLIAGAYHTAGRGHMIRKGFEWRHCIEATRVGESPDRLAQMRTAIEAGDQALAMAVAHCYHELGGPARPMLDLLLEYSVEADGALHAEKFFLTSWEDFHESRPAFRDRYLMGLARVCASQHGWEAPGLEDAKARLRAV